MVDLIKPQDLDESAAPEPIAPQHRSDIGSWPYNRLISLGRDVENIGSGRLVISYAGSNPQRIKVTCKSGKAAKRTQMLLRRDLRKATSDAQYNEIVEAFFAAIRKAADEEQARPSD